MARVRSRLVTSIVRQHLHVHKCDRSHHFSDATNGRGTANKNKFGRFLSLSLRGFDCRTSTVLYRPRRILFASTTPSITEMRSSKMLGLSDGQTGYLISFVGHHAKGRFASLRLKARPSLYIYCSLLVNVCVWGKKERHNLNRLDFRRERERESEKCVRFQDERAAPFVLFNTFSFSSFLQRDSTSSYPPTVIMRVLLPTARPFPRCPLGTI